VRDLATSIKQGTVTASLMLKKACQLPQAKRTCQSIEEIGRIERTLFMLDWFRDPALRRRVQAGLNKEARNALARAVSCTGWVKSGTENRKIRAIAPVD
jgi:TnpA family transposase